MSGHAASWTLRDNTTASHDCGRTDHLKDEILERSLPIISRLSSRQPGRPVVSPVGSLLFVGIGNRRGFVSYAGSAPWRRLVVCRGGGDGMPRKGLPHSPETQGLP